ncbi:hypothetical protein Lal_00038491 [Lupinus albus]|nr:hypothetical protein Lal_00038491 [Lupinus albus]
MDTEGLILSKLALPSLTHAYWDSAFTGTFTFRDNPVQERSNYKDRDRVESPASQSVYPRARAISVAEQAESDQSNAPGQKEDVNRSLALVVPRAPSFKFSFFNDERRDFT